MSDLTRRDFLNGAALAIVGRATPAELLAQQAATGIYPPGLTGLRGQTDAAFAAPHSMAMQGKRFRLGGMVASGSFKRAPGSMEAHFAVDDGDATLPVVFTGILPDLFREKQAVVATGRMQGGVFVAEEVLAKHDETYMPKEVADKMGVAHQKHDVQVPAAEQMP